MTRLIFSLVSLAESQGMGYLRKPVLTLLVVLIATTIPSVAHSQCCCDPCSQACDFACGGCCANGCCAVHPQDELWFISTRHLGCPTCEPLPPRLEVRRYEQGAWLPSSMDAFIAAEWSEEKPPITVFYIHGNQEDRAMSFDSGRLAYCALTRNRVSERPLRFVIWSWPSDRVFGPLRDVRVKAARTDLDAYYLGWLLTQMDPRIPISFVGFSYGARIALGALHLSAGGMMCGWMLPIAPDRPISRVRLVVYAAAEHNYWLVPGQRHANAYLRINRMLNAYNSADPVLQRYRWLDLAESPEAMGYTGAVGTAWLDDGGARLDQINVCPLVGSTHSSEAYFSTPLIVRETQRYVYWLPFGE